MNHQGPTLNFDKLIPWQRNFFSDAIRTKAKRAFEICLGKMLQPLPSSESDEEVPYLKAQHVHWGKVRFTDLPKMWASPKEIEQLSLLTADLLVCEGGEVGRAAILHETPVKRCIIQNALHRVRNLPRGEVRFLAYCLEYASQQKWFDVLCNKATIAHFTVEKFQDLWLFLPPLEKQRRIANFLDRETARIDELVAEKEKMLELLEEKRSALISRAVTRSLDPNVPLKPSGLPWLGDIPTHWETKRSKRVLRERDERSVSGEEELLTVSHITGVTKRSEKDVNMFEAETKEGYKICSPGNLVINTLWAWMGAMGVSKENGLVSPAYHVYELSNLIFPDYIDLLVRTPAFAKEVTRFSKGVWSSRLRLYPEGLYEVHLPIPPIKEQKEIVAVIARERQKTFEFEKILKDSILLIKERRSALITATVTGQIEMKE